MIEGFKKLEKEWALLLMWLVLVIFISAYHELWRDEVRAFSVAIAPGHPGELMASLKNEGHPILLYLILRIGYALTHTYFILQIAAIIIGFAGVYLFYRLAPFPLWIKILFLWGVLPLYEYSVMARNYGISMVLFFLFAFLYEKRDKRPFLLATVLVLLANTNASAWILSLLLAAFWFWEEVVAKKEVATGRERVMVLSSFLLVAFGIAFSLATTYPSPDSIITRSGSFAFSSVLQALWKNFLHPGLRFSDLLNNIPRPLRDGMFWLLVLGLLIRPALAFFLLAGMVGLGVFFDTVYEGDLRHQGMLFCYMIALFWMGQKNIPSSTSGEKPIRRWLHSLAVKVIIPAMLIIQIFPAVTLIKRDIAHEVSSGRALGRFLNVHPEYRDAVILGEPDYILESLPYYAPNRIFLPREGVFRNYVMFTRANREKLSLEELLENARMVRKAEKKPVLIVLGHFDLSEKPPHSRPFSYKKTFTWSPETLKAFQDSTEKIVEFRKALTDENYRVYWLLD